MTQQRRLQQPELRNNQVHIGNLSPADFLFISSFATCFPMITKPSDVQLTFDIVNADTLAINHEICKAFIIQELLAMHQSDGDLLQYMEVYTRLQLIATNTINDSIDFLPHFE